MNGSTDKLMKYSFWNRRKYYYKYSFNFPFDFTFIFTLLTHLVAGSVWAFSLPTPSGFSWKFATQPSLIKPAILQLDFRLVGQGGREVGGWLRAAAFAVQLSSNFIFDTRSHLLCWQFVDPGRCRWHHEGMGFRRRRRQVFDPLAIASVGWGKRGGEGWLYCLLSL